MLRPLIDAISAGTQFVHSSDDTYYLLGRSIGLAHRRWTIQFNTALSSLGHTNLRWMALSIIAEAGGELSQRQLAHKLGADEPAITRLVSALEDSGLVARRRSGDDRRKKLLTVTPAAREGLKAGAEVGAALRARVFGGLPDEDIAAAQRVLAAVCDRLLDGAGASDGKGRIEVEAEDEAIWPARAILERD